MRLQLLWAYEKSMLGVVSPSGTSYSFQSALLVLKGWAEAGESPSRHKRATQGQWLILRQGPRWQRFSDDAVVLSIGFRFQLPTGEAIYDENFPVKVESSDWPGLERAAGRVMSSMKKHVSLSFFPRQQVVNMRDFLLSQSALRLFLIELADIFQAEGVRPRTMSQGNTHVLDALEIIDHIPPGKTMTAQDIAAQTGITLTHMDRLMVAETGHTVHKQLEMRRLVLAQDALLANTASLKSIAYDLGFCSPSHFNHWFRKNHGQTPLQFRQHSALS